MPATEIVNGKRETKRNNPKMHISYVHVMNMQIAGEMALSAPTVAALFLKMALTGQRIAVVP